MILPERQIPANVLTSKYTMFLNFQQLLTLWYHPQKSTHLSFLQNKNFCGASFNFGRSGGHKAAEVNSDFLPILSPFLRAIGD